MNRVYISIRVSAELRREVDRAYLRAAQQLGRKYSLNEFLCDVLRAGLAHPEMTALARLHKVETRLEDLRADLDRQRRTILKSSNSDSAPEEPDDAN